MLSDIYSPENIARSRARAVSLRRMVALEELGPEWLDAADEVDAYAADRERESDVSETRADRG